jgi:uncharacterized protein
VEFHASRDYFECHELLEDYWKEHPNDGRGEIWVGLIQTAVGQYHERRGNLRGAAMMYEQALAKLSVSELEPLGLDKESLIEQLSKRKQTAANGMQEYKDIDMKLVHEPLLERCGALCMEQGLTWGIPSPYHDDSIIHRHLKRDRTEVIAARDAALRAKREGNGQQ